MAVASQKITEMMFLDLMRGALIAAPTMDEPVMKMPLGVRREGGRHASQPFKPKATTTLLQSGQGE